MAVVRACVLQPSRPHPPASIPIRHILQPLDQLKQEILPEVHVHRLLEQVRPSDSGLDLASVQVGQEPADRRVRRSTIVDRIDDLGAGQVEVAVHRHLTSRVVPHADGGEGVDDGVLELLVGDLLAERGRARRGFRTRRLPLSLRCVPIAVG